MQKQYIELNNNRLPYRVTQKVNTQTTPPKIYENNVTQGAIQVLCFALTEQRIDVQGHSRSTSFVAIERQ